MTKYASFFLVAALLILAGCKDESRTGKIALAGRLFVFNPRLATATAVITVDVQQELPVGATILLTFENPAGGTPLTLEQIARPLQKRIDFETEPLQCIRNGKRYSFTLMLQDANNNPLQKIESSLESTLDQSILPNAPLVEGPGYEPNPALEKSEAGTTLRNRFADCPA